MTKHTFTIDIEHGALIEQCASKILAQYHGDYDEYGDLIDNGNNKPHKQIDRVIRETVVAQVRKHLEASIEEFTQAHIRAAVEAIMSEGWQKTNSYGEPCGPKMTLRDRIAEQLTSVRDSYSRKTWLDEVIEKNVTAVFSAEFAKQIEDARHKFRELLDGTIAAKLQESLKSALGLR